MSDDVFVPSIVPIEPKVVRSLPSLPLVEAQAFAEAFHAWKQKPAGEDDWQPVMDAYERWRLAQ